MTLGDKQRLFTNNVALLILFAYNQGYELTFAEAYRTPEQAALNAKKGSGIKNSLHTQRLAIDLNLFKRGKYLTSSKAHKPLGDFWTSVHPDNRWGGTFGDGNHYSMEHGGIK